LQAEFEWNNKYDVIIKIAKGLDPGNIHTLIFRYLIHSRSPATQKTEEHGKYFIPDDL
jgi:hypothetical protein